MGGGNLIINFVLLSFCLGFGEAYAENITICPPTETIKCDDRFNPPMYTSNSGPGSWAGSGNPDDSCKKLSFYEGVVLGPTSTVVACEYKYYSNYVTGYIELQIRKDLAGYKMTGDKNCVARAWFNPMQTFEYGVNCQINNARSTVP